MRPHETGCRTTLTALATLRMSGGGGPARSSDAARASQLEIANSPATGNCCGRKPDLAAAGMNATDEGGAATATGPKERVLSRTKALANGTVAGLRSAMLRSLMLAGLRAVALLSALRALAGRAAEAAVEARLLSGRSAIISDRKQQKAVLASNATPSASSAGARCAALSRRMRALPQAIVSRLTKPFLSQAPSQGHPSTQFSTSRGAQDCEDPAEARKRAPWWHFALRTPRALEGSSWHDARCFLHSSAKK